MNSEFLGFLRRHGIAFERCDHPAVFTTAEAEKLVPPMGGARAKNLFNTATLVISREHLARFLSLTGHEPLVMLIPPDTAAPAAVSERAAD